MIEIKPLKKEGDFVEKQLKSIIVKRDGKPDRLAIEIYSRLKGWFQPNKDNRFKKTGKLDIREHGFRTSYEELAKEHSCSKEVVRQKIVLLEELGLASRDFRIEYAGGIRKNNVLHLLIWKETPYFHFEHGLEKRPVFNSNINKETWKKIEKESPILSKKLGVAPPTKEGGSLQQTLDIINSNTTPHTTPHIRIDNHDHQDNQFIDFSNFSEKDSDSFYEIYEEYLGKDPILPEEVIIQEEPKPGISAKDDSWRIKARDYHKPIGALVVETDQFIEREMLKLQAAGYDVTEIEDNHKINLDINKGALENTACLEIPKPLETKACVDAAVKRVAKIEAVVQTHHTQAKEVVQTDTKPQQQAKIYQYNLIKDRVSFVDKDGKTYWGMPLVKFRYTRAMIEQVRLGSNKPHFAHERIVGLLSYIADKYPDKLIIGGKAGFISYMIKLVNGEMEYTKEEKLESIEEKRKAELKEMEDMFNNGRIQWA